MRARPPPAARHLRAESTGSEIVPATITTSGRGSASNETCFSGPSRSSRTCSSDARSGPDRRTLRALARFAKPAECMTSRPRPARSRQFTACRKPPAHAPPHVPPQLAPSANATTCRALLTAPRRSLASCAAALARRGSDCHWWAPRRSTRGTREHRAERRAERQAEHQAERRAEHRAGLAARALTCPRDRARAASTPAPRPP